MGQMFSLEQLLFLFVLLPSFLGFSFFSPGLSSGGVPQALRTKVYIAVIGFYRRTPFFGCSFSSREIILMSISVVAIYCLLSHYPRLRLFLYYEKVLFCEITCWVLLVYFGDSDRLNWSLFRYYSVKQRKD